MPQYVVTKDCYVPVGESTRFKHAGQVVSLDEADAKVLGGLVKRAGQDEVEAQVVVQPQGDAADDSEGVQELNTDVPTSSDVKAAWVDFAVSQGQDRDDAEAMTKAELIEQFG